MHFYLFDNISRAVVSNLITLVLIRSSEESQSKSVPSNEEKDQVKWRLVIISNLS